MHQTPVWPLNKPTQTTKLVVRDHYFYQYKAVLKETGIFLFSFHFLPSPTAYFIYLQLLPVLFDVIFILI